MSVHSDHPARRTHVTHPPRHRRRAAWATALIAVPCLAAIQLLPVSGEARIQFAGGLTAGGTGEAYWVEAPHLMTGEPVFGISLALLDGEVLHVLEIASTGGRIPPEGDYPVIPLDDLPFPGEEPRPGVPEGFSVSYLSGRWGSMAEVRAMAEAMMTGDMEKVQAFGERTVEHGLPLGGRVTFTRRGADVVEGTLELEFTVVDHDHEERTATATAEFRATRLPESGGSTE